MQFMPRIHLCEEHYDQLEQELDYVPQLIPDYVPFTSTKCDHRQDEGGPCKSPVAKSFFMTLIPAEHYKTPAALLGAIGGKSTSEAKRKAVAANGLKGGRPRKDGFNLDMHKAVESKIQVSKKLEGLNIEPIEE